MKPEPALTTYRRTISAAQNLLVVRSHRAVELQTVSRTGQITRRITLRTSK
jgi:hypothetical protein